MLQIHEIFELLPNEIQVGVASAAMPPEALEITRKLMKKPVMIIQGKRDEQMGVQEKHGEPVRVQENCGE
jgi:superfamily II DNA/RNA helicase